MKFKRKSHEISEDEDDSFGNQTKGKRPKLSQNVLSLTDLDPDDEIWLVRLPSHLDAAHLHNKKV